MSPEERTRLKALDEIVCSKDVRAQIAPIVERVRTELAAKKEAAMTWVPIPQNVWHQPVISKGADWVVVSFHTVPAEELIEERPGDVADSGTKQMVYLRKK